MARRLSIGALILFASSTAPLHAAAKDEKMFAKDVGAMVGLTEECDLHLSPELAAAMADVSERHPEDFAATKGFAAMAKSRNPEICDRAPGLLEEFDKHIAERG